MDKIIDYFDKHKIPVTVIVSLLIFFSGFFVNGFIKYIGKCVKKHNYRKTIIIIINQFNNRSRVQVDELDKVLSQKGYLFADGYDLKIASNFGLKYLSTTDVKEFMLNFTSLTARHRTIKIVNLFESIERVIQAKKMFDKIIESVHKSYQEQYKIYNDELTSLRKLQEDLPIKYKQLPEDIDFRNYLISIPRVFNGWIEGGCDSSIWSTYNILVKPWNEQAKAAPITEVSRLVIDHTLTCILAVENIQNAEKILKSQTLNAREMHAKASADGVVFVSQWEKRNVIRRVLDYFSI